MCRSQAIYLDAAGAARCDRTMRLRVGFAGCVYESAHCDVIFAEPRRLFPASADHGAQPIIVIHPQIFNAVCLVWVCERFLGDLLAVSSVNESHVILAKLCIYVSNYYIL